MSGFCEITDEDGSETYVNLANNIFKIAQVEKSVDLDDGIYLKYNGLLYSVQPHKLKEYPQIKYERLFGYDYGPKEQLETKYNSIYWIPEQFSYSGECNHDCWNHTRVTFSLSNKFSKYDPTNHTVGTIQYKFIKPSYCLDLQNHCQLCIGSVIFAIRPTIKDNYKKDSSEDMLSDKSRYLGFIHEGDSKSITNSYPINSDNCFYLKDNNQTLAIVPYAYCKDEIQ